MIEAAWQFLYIKWWFNFVYYRKRNEKHSKKREPIPDDTAKKPVGDFGSKSMNEYLLGSRKLKPFPVAMSLVAR